MLTAKKWTVKTAKHGFVSNCQTSFDLKNFEAGVPKSSAVASGFKWSYDWTESSKATEG